MKKYKKIILAGGSGYLGSVLKQFYANEAEEIIILSRRAGPAKGNVRTLQWDGKALGPWAAELEGTDLLVNLTGKNVNCRYTPENRKEILASRVDSVKVLEEAVRQCKVPPATWVQCASATIYRDADDRPMDEETGEIGSGFSVDVCKQWEQAFWNTQVKDTRRVVLRIGIALGKEGSIFPRLRNLVLCGLGGKQGNGKQYVNWIHKLDFARIVEFVHQHKKDNATYNCVAPGSARNAEVMRVIRKAYHMPFGLPSPAWLLAIGARIIGTETELILKSRWVLPTKLLKEGFVFEYPQLEQAVEQIVRA